MSNLEGRFFVGGALIGVVTCATVLVSQAMVIGIGISMVFAVLVSALVSKQLRKLIDLPPEIYLHTVYRLAIGRSFNALVRTMAWVCAISMAFVSAVAGLGAAHAVFTLLLRGLHV